MSRKAYLCDADGTRHLVKAADCSDRTATYLCAGMIGGETCLAPVELRQRMGTNYFAVAAKASHIRNCPCDESRREVTKKILDIDGKEYTTRGIFELLCQKKPAKGPGGPPPKGGGPEGGGAPGDEDEDFPMADVKTIGRPPKSLKELVKCLSYYNPKDYFAGRLVEDQFCNKTTIDKYMRCGFPVGEPVVVCVRKTQPPAGWVRKKGEIILAADGSNGGLYVVITAEQSVREKIFEKDGKVTQFYLINTWTRQADNIFTADHSITQHLFYST